MGTTSVREQIIRNLSDGASKPFDEILASFKPHEHILVEGILSDLVDEDVVRPVGKPGKRAFKLGRTSPLSQNAGNAAPPSTTIVATFPESIWSSNPQVENTKHVYRRLFNETVRELFILQPFIDNSFIEIYADDFRNLASRGVRLVLVTRTVEQNRDTLQAIVRLYEIFTLNSRNKDACQVYEHWFPLLGPNDRRTQFIGLHAKVVFNEKEVYVGSANWTEYSLGNNIEIGLTTTDTATLGNLKNILFLITTNSKRIDLAALHRRAVDRTRR